MAEHRIDDITKLIEKSGLSRNSINKLYRTSIMPSSVAAILFEAL
ncbi:hypothetical protein [Paenibacillus sp. S150]|nr:hypothetical protein [Paenibacillus sp. S150]